METNRENLVARVIFCWPYVVLLKNLPFFISVFLQSIFDKYGSHDHPCGIRFPAACAVVTDNPSVMVDARARLVKAVVLDEALETSFFFEIVCLLHGASSLLKDILNLDFLKAIVDAHRLSVKTARLPPPSLIILSGVFCWALKCFLFLLFFTPRFGKKPGYIQSFRSSRSCARSPF